VVLTTQPTFQGSKGARSFSAQNDRYTNDRDRYFLLDLTAKENNETIERPFADLAGSSSAIQGRDALVRLG